MPELTVAVLPVADRRFMILLVEPPFGEPKREPDAGSSGKGYTEDVLRMALAQRYGLSWPEIEERIAAARA
ncbi:MULTISPECIES: hypothetical protein [unclassified Acidisoma]|jgi:hypothetical protein|uniref:hypothetical protein n=1 Tax=unclassified Acidisoma TaxID=2634065 RepID=UPI00131E5993|nr:MULTISPECIES: hypothetical protein [unclassified Acidisoma]